MEKTFQVTTASMSRAVWKAVLDVAFNLSVPPAAAELTYPEVMGTLPEKPKQ